MLGISVARTGDQLVIRWQFTRIAISMDTVHRALIPV